MVVLGLNFLKPFYCVLDWNEVMDALEIRFGSKPYQDRWKWRPETTVSGGSPRGSGSGRRLHSGEGDELDDVVFYWNGQTIRRSTGLCPLFKANKRHVVAHGKTTCRSEITEI